MTFLHRVARRTALSLSCLALGGITLESARAAEVPASTLASATAALRDAAQRENVAFELLRSLTAEVGHRLAGSPGDARAVAWAESKLKTLGFDSVRTEPVTVPHWERGENRGWITAPWPQEVVVLALGGSEPTPAGGLEAPVMRVTSLDEVKALPDGAAQGKIVFIDERMERTRDGSGYGKAVAKRGAGASESAKKGAVAVLIRSAGTSSHRFAHTGGTRYQDGVTRIPAASLSNADADVLAEQLKPGSEVRFRLQLDTRTLPDVPSANVIAEVRGRERPEEIVLLGAHLDSWDVGQGAQDDGAGVAIVTAAAKAIAGLPQRPRRTVRVVLFANEEFGLSGARAYAVAHAEELPRHVAAVESDFGSGAPIKFSSLVEANRLAELEELAALLAPLGVERGDNESGGGADLSPMRPARVPTFSIAQDGTLYFDIHHTQDDTLAQVNPQDLSANVAAYAAWAYWLAERESNLGRAPEEEPAPRR